MTPSNPRRLRYVLDPETMRLWALPAGGDENDDGGDGDDDEVVTISKSDLQNLRGAAERGSKRATENAELRKENAFIKAGVNRDSKAGALLFKHAEPNDDGEFDIEAIRQDAEELGALQPTADNDGGPTTEPGEEQSTAERQSLAGTGTPPPEADPGEHPNERAKRAHDDVLSNGGRSEAAQVAYAEEIFAAASDGDERVLVTTQPPAETV